MKNGSNKIPITRVAVKPPISYHLRFSLAPHLGQTSADLLTSLSQSLHLIKRGMPIKQLL